MNLRRMIFVVVFSCLCLNAVPCARGAELLSQFHPYISVKEEYNDNINLTSTDKKDDYITTVQPGVRFSNMDKLSGIDLDYSLGAVFYGKNTNLNYLSHNGLLNAKYRTAEHFNFSLKDSFIRSEDNREREYFTTVAQNEYQLSTQTNRSVYLRNVVQPTVEYQFGREDRVGLNYRNNVYRTDNPDSQNSQENYVSPFFSYWFDKQNGVYLEYGFTKGDFEKDPDLTGHQIKGRYTYRFNPKASVFAEYSYLKREFTSPGIDYDINEPDVGITYDITPTVIASAQAGYFWRDPKTGSKTDGLSYRGSLTNLDREARTTYTLSFQGGYTEDYFTSQNLGFSRYHRITGSITHLPERRMSVGAFGSVEWADFTTPDHNDTVYGIGATASYTPLKWLTLALEVAHNERQSNVDGYEYTENRGMLKMTATY
jgi:hypothetical protein